MAPRTLADATAIGVSTLCLAHCLAAPVLLTLVPWLVPGLFVDERFHVIAVLTAVPVSALALAGTLQARPMIVTTVALGLAMLVAATRVQDEALETTLTVAGALLVLLAHLRNYVLRATS